MIDFIREVGFTSGAEIGTEHGSYAERMCKANPQLHLHCIDPYLALPYYDGYKEQKEVDSFYEIAKNKLAKYNCTIIKKSSMEAVKEFSPNSLDFVFIDGNHYFEFVINDMIYWSRVVKPGGIVYGHDYSDQFDVKDAVQVYMKVYGIDTWFILNKRGLIDSWLFIRTESDKIWKS